MRAITIYQPWASLIAVSAKTYETRSWATRYRGPIAIHAGKKKPSAIMTAEDIDIIIPAMGRAFGMQERSIINIIKYLDSLPIGAVIATAELVGCWKCIGPDRRGDLMLHNGLEGMAADNWYIGDDELLFGDFSEGRYAWELANVQMLPEPVPARGQQRLFNIDLEDLK